MKKTLTTLAIAAGVISAPVLSMSITPTRELLLGLTPDEQILAIADKLDTDKTELQQKLDDKEQKITELQSALDAQSQQMTEQQEATEQKVAEVQETVVRQKDCSADVARYCVSDSFMDKDKFEKMMNNYKQHGDDVYEKWLPEKKALFDNCQKALKCQ